MEPRPYRITLRSMLVAVFWVSVCLASWAAPGAINAPWAPLVGWLALCTGVAALFGDALRFAIVGGGIVCLMLVGGALAIALGLVMPPQAALGIVVAISSISAYWLARRFNRKRA